jgi:N-acetylmuramoyl-L-alanine amidase
MNARGWSVYTTKGLTNSDKYATIFFDEANRLLPSYGQKLRADWSDGDPDWEENFTILYKARCPAILTENLFYDNKEDLKFLQSNLGRSIISQIHINAIKKASSI